MIRLIFALLLLPAVLWADQYPGIYDVTGVASDDVLNIREQPSAKSAIIGELAHDDFDIEVVARKGKWGRVNTNERSGWVSMRYMKRLPESDYAVGRLIGCNGTEPFWGLDIAQGHSVLFQIMGEDKIRVAAGLMAPAVGRIDRYRLIADSGSGTRLAMVMRHAACNDGMSDRDYGLEVDVLYSTPGDGTMLLSGCCSLVEY